MAQEYKTNNDIPNLYHILGLTVDVCKDPDCNELIQRAYVKKAKVCHPDKHPDRPEITEVFELITNAYDILRNEKEREEYNKMLILNRQNNNDFLNLKQLTREYMSSLGEYKPPSVEQRNLFGEKMKELNVKHGYDVSIEKTPIPVEEAKQRLKDTINARTTQDIELKPDNLFDGQFDLKKFNAAFDMMHQKNEGSIIPYSGVPAAWGWDSLNYSSLNNDNLYDNNKKDIYHQSYGGLDFGALPIKKITKEDINNIEGADYVLSHNVLDDDYYNNLKSKLAQRKNETEELEKFSYSQYQLKDATGVENNFELAFKDTYDDIDSNISKKVDKLLANYYKSDNLIEKTRRR